MLFFFWSYSKFNYFAWLWCHIEIFKIIEVIDMKIYYID